ncbi:MAG: hypothetical protein J6U64_00130 [Alphaproteobacteria bacterium]|nr:hypothetical protein [Alphaproteobacteria bacterium]
MKKLIFFVLFLSVCSVGVYAYFYWKAMQIRTPIVSMEVVIPQKEVLKKTPVSKQNVFSKNTDPLSVSAPSTPLEIKSKNASLTKPVENEASLKEPQIEQIKESKKEVPLKDTVSHTEKNTDVQEIVPENEVQKTVPENNIQETVPVVVSETSEPTDTVPLLIPTTEPIVKENVPVVSQ